MRELSTFDQTNYTHGRHCFLFFTRVYILIPATISRYKLTTLDHNIILKAFPTRADRHSNILDAAQHVLESLITSEFNENEDIKCLLE